MYLQKISYNTNKFNFAELLCKEFGVSDLSEINSSIPILKRETDQGTLHHKVFYKWMETNIFTNMYQSFIQSCIRPLYDDKIIVQAKPTFRICYPNNKAVGEYHKDKDYRNGEWALTVKELNYFLPFTNAFDTNTIWVESEEDKQDFAPMDCKYGEFIQWDGSNLSHGNKINTTGKTRISVDFRVIKHKNYIPNNKGSINLNKQFKIGGYYKVYE